MPNSENNPILREVHGVPIRKYNYVSIQFNETAYEKLINQSYETGLSVSKLVAIKSQPCQFCQCDNVTLIIRKDGHTNIQNSSETIIKKNGKGHQNT